MRKYSGDEIGSYVIHTRIEILVLDALDFWKENESKVFYSFCLCL